MKPNERAKFIRVVLASAVGSLLWAGCATNNTIIHDPAGSEVTANSGPVVAGVPIDQEDIAAAPVDLTKRRPDTHPELRSGLWQTISQNQGVDTASLTAPVSETAAVEPEASDASIDTGHLAPYAPEVVNIAMDDAAADGIIVEAAGAERPKRLWSKKTMIIEPPAPPPAPPVIEPAPGVEIRPIPQSYTPPPSPAPLKNDSKEETGPLRKVFFVRK